jgi:hypothetical protein
MRAVQELLDHRPLMTVRCAHVVNLSKENPALFRSRLDKAPVLLFPICGFGR